MAIVLGLTRLPGVENLAPDYIQFWSASNILLDGGDPYDPQLQTAYNAAAGWDKNQQGLGRYAFLPYYYPPWLALALSPLVPLGYAGAKLVWLALLIECVIATAYLLRNSVPGMNPLATMIVCLGFGVWWVTLPIGQTAPLVVLLLVAGWRLLDAAHDRAAGVVLAWTTIKPQLTICVLAVFIVWAIRQRRWRVLQGLVAMGSLLLLVSTCVFPGWLPAMLDAPRQTPMVTIDRPWLASSWWALLRTFGFSGGLLGALYLALAVPVAALTLRAAWDRGTPALQLFALATLATLALVPYVRYYDFPVLLLPLVEVLGRPLPGSTRGLLAASFMIVPLALWVMIAGEPSVVVGQLQGLWMVAALLGTWIWSDRQQAIGRRSSLPIATQSLRGT